MKFLAKRVSGAWLRSRSGLYLLLALVSGSVSGQSGDVNSRASGTYRIEPLDVIIVRLFVADEMQFTHEERVSQDGYFSPPYLGKIRVAGLNLEETRELLFQPYNADYFVKPHIEVQVAAYSQPSVQIFGKVNRQGPVFFPAEEPMFLLEAISKAGGWSNDRLADKRNVKITRTLPSGESETFEVDARNLTTLEIPLKDGDVVNVPERMW